MKILIIYYSKSGNTEIVAKTLSKELPGDLIEIEDNKKRDGMFAMLRSGIDAFRGVKTKISPEKLDLDDYDLIYIGTPVWAGKPTPAIITAINKYDFKGKNIILFATMKSSGDKKTIEKMKEKIQVRGAKVINSFSIKTQSNNESNIKDDTIKFLLSFGK
ncbi:MAG: flavodoxin [Methanobrevibacter sp.]|jgi:flavodoxin|nr:flavodoxin [Candidatus Methanovirga basalitermitum]